jgi:hypothetical protein
MKPFIRIHNVETDEVIDREMTDAEFAEYELGQVKAEEERQAEAIKAADKVALLARLGMTADEAKLLLS